MANETESLGKRFPTFSTHTFWLLNFSLLGKHKIPAAFAQNNLSFSRGRQLPFCGLKFVPKLCFMVISSFSVKLPKCQP